MSLGGFKKLSAIDYPGKLVSMIYIQGCNWRCGFCQNPSLLSMKNNRNDIKLQMEDILKKLNDHKKWIDGACITGGEPTLYPKLEELIKLIKNENFLVKLDTNGSNPSIVKNLIQKDLLDYVAQDIKTVLKTTPYSKLVGKQVEIDNIKKTFNLLKDSGIEFEIRTTVIPGYVTDKEVLQIAQELQPRNFTYYLQNFSPKITYKREFEAIQPYKMTFLHNLANKIRTAYKFNCKVAGI